MDFLDRYMSPAVKTIVLLCAVLFFAPAVLDVFKPGFQSAFNSWFALDPRAAIGRLQVWQFLTYMFLHGGLFHLLFNMLTLFFFGPAIENRLGTKLFWLFFLISGVAAALMHVLLYFLWYRYTGFGLPGIGDMVPGLVGASGAIMFVLLAFAAYFPEQEVLLYMAIPVKMKVLIAIIIVLDLIGMSDPSSSVAHIAHLGGLAAGYVLLSRYHRDWRIGHWRWR